MRGDRVVASTPVHRACAGSGRAWALFLTARASLPVAAVVLVFGLGVSGGAQAAQAPSAAQLLHTALADAGARGSVS